MCLQRKTQVCTFSSPLAWVRELRSLPRLLSGNARVSSSFQTSLQLSDDRCGRTRKKKWKFGILRQISYAWYAPKLSKRYARSGDLKTNRTHLTLVPEEPPVQTSPLAPPPSQCSRRLPIGQGTAPRRQPQATSRSAR